MKILYVTNLYPPHNLGGYELICETVNRAMQARGHETHVLTSNHEVAGRGIPEDETGVARTLRIHGFFGNPWLGVRTLRGVELHNNRALREAIERFQPDVVHVFNLGGLSKSLAHTLQRSGVPTVYFVSDHWIAQSLAADVWLDWWNRPASSFVQRAVRAGMKLSGIRALLDWQTPTSPARAVDFRRIYFCSRFLRDQAVERGYDVGHAAVIYNAVDTVRFTPAAGDEAGRFERLLFVGRLTPEKGIATVLRALARIRGTFAGKLTVCGRGDAGYEATLRHIVDSMHLPVTFIDAAAAEMPEIYRRHDALIFASEWEEPFALTPLEAMACGLPVIATTTGGSAEIFRDNLNSLTFEAGDDEDLARQIMKLQNDPRLRHRIGLAGCGQVREDFSEERVMDRVEQFVLESVETWPERPASGLRPAQPETTAMLAYV